MNKQQLLNQAEYIDIILTLLQPPYEISSVSKLVFISFCVQYGGDAKLYKNRHKDFVDVFFETISLKLITHQEELLDIFAAIDILNKNSKVIIESDYITINCEYLAQSENSFLNRIRDKTPNPIVEINKLDVKALIEEVIRYV